MAERRMFNKSLMFSNAFSQLSKAAQLLYMFLNLMADDDGICANSRVVCKMCGSTKKHLKELVDGLWLLEFPGGEVVVKHWHVHNQIRKDRYKPSIHRGVTEKLRKGASGEYALAEDGCHFGNQLATQDRIGQDSIAQDSIDQHRIAQDRGGQDMPAATSSEPPVAACDDTDFEKILYYYQLMCPNLVPCQGLTPVLREKMERCCREGYTPLGLLDIFMKANMSGFLQGDNRRNWKAVLGWLMEPLHLQAVRDGKYDTWI